MEKEKVNCEQCSDSGFFTIPKDMDGVSRTVLCGCEAGRKAGKRYFMATGEGEVDRGWIFYTHFGYEWEQAEEKGEIEASLTEDYSSPGVYFDYNKNEFVELTEEEYKKVAELLEKTASDNPDNEEAVAAQAPLEQLIEHILDQKGVEKS